MIGNSIIITLVCIDYRLQSPMYFFLCNLFLIEIPMIMTVVPKMLENFLSGRNTISFYGCLGQSYFYFLLGISQYVLLVTMSYDQYVAICYPLNYSTIMNRKVCVWLVVGSWMEGFFSILVPTVIKLGLPYCGPNIINHFFCYRTPLLYLTCADIWLVEFIKFIISLPVLLGSVMLMVISYVYIICTIICIPSTKGRKKAFSTCSSHFIIITMGYGSCIFMYVRPSGSDTSLNKLVALLNTVVTPLMSPFIFSMRNQQIKDSLRAALKRSMNFSRKHINF
ncbi:olfactory receptor 49-like [Trachemys scripta elegans]|uniref:olfactory receptor 49-like n=1 Tax=Trachemys scripta elegans TaxID=31138 RepID=UPI0015580815|nr:olfactory receptor 49-like [Trachemys scripta elegans]